MQVTQAAYLIPCYFVNENREKQMLRMIALLCSRLNYQMKDYMNDQIHSDESFDLVHTTMNYPQSTIALYAL